MRFVLRPQAWQRRAAMVATVLMVVSVGIAAGPASSATAGGIRCDEARYPLHLLGGDYEVRGTLCRPIADAAPRATVVLLHGSTYSRDYWDFPLDPANYSTTRYLAAAGYQTLALDRLGSGQSSRPPADAVTADVSSDAVHQVVAQLRDRSRPEGITSSGKVFLAGHSSGSSLAVRESAQFSDVDGLVLTGFIHNFGPDSGIFQAITHPAADDPKFRGNPAIPAGYVTSEPGGRLAFYYPFTADERIYSLDEETKDAMPPNDFGGFTDEITSGGKYARQVKVPVLDIIGERDILSCTPPNCPEAGKEAGFYPASSRFRMVVQPRVGHDINLHRSAPETNNTIREWTDVTSSHGEDGSK